LKHFQAETAISLTAESRPRVFHKSPYPNKRQQIRAQARMRGVRLSRERIRPQATSAANDRPHCADANHFGRRMWIPEAAIRAA